MSNFNPNKRDFDRFSSGESEIYSQELSHSKRSITSDRFENFNDPNYHNKTNSLTTDNTNTTTFHNSLHTNNINNVNLTNSTSCGINTDSFDLLLNTDQSNITNKLNKNKIDTIDIGDLSNTTNNLEMTINNDIGVKYDNENKQEVIDLSQSNNNKSNEDINMFDDDLKFLVNPVIKDSMCNRLDDTVNLSPDILLIDSLKESLMNMVNDDSAVTDKSISIDDSPNIIEAHDNDELNTTNISLTIDLLNEENKEEINDNHDIIKDKLVNEIVLIKSGSYKNYLAQVSSYQLNRYCCLLLFKWPIPTSVNISDIFDDFDKFRKTLSRSATYVRESIDLIPITHSAYEISCKIKQLLIENKQKALSVFDEINNNSARSNMNLFGKIVFIIDGEFKHHLGFVYYKLPENKYNILVLLKLPNNLLYVSNDQLSDIVLKEKSTESSNNLIFVRSIHSEYNTASKLRTFIKNILKNNYKTLIVNSNNKLVSSNTTNNIIMSIFNEGSTIDSASSRNSSSIDNKDVNETASIYIIESLKSTFESQKTTNTILVSEKPSNENVIESSRDIDVASSDERGTIFEKIDDKVDIQNCNDFFVIDTVKTVINKNDDVIRKNDEDIQKNDEEMVSNFLPMDIESDFPRRDSLLSIHKTNIEVMNNSNAFSNNDDITTTQSEIERLKQSFIKQTKISGMISDGQKITHDNYQVKTNISKLSSKETISSGAIVYITRSEYCDYFGIILLNNDECNSHYVVAVLTRHDSILCHQLILLNNLAITKVLTDERMTFNSIFTFNFLRNDYFLTTITLSKEYFIAINMNSTNQSTKYLNNNQLKKLSQQLGLLYKSINMTPKEFIDLRESLINRKSNALIDNIVLIKSGKFKHYFGKIIEVVNNSLSLIILCSLSSKLTNNLLCNKFSSSEIFNPKFLGYLMIEHNELIINVDVISVNSGTTDLYVIGNKLYNLFINFRSTDDNKDNYNILVNDSSSYPNRLKNKSNKIFNIENYNPTNLNIVITNTNATTYLSNIVLIKSNKYNHHYAWIYKIIPNKNKYVCVILTKYGSKLCNQLIQCDEPYSNEEFYSNFFETSNTDYIGIVSVQDFNDIVVYDDFTDDEYTVSLKLAVYFRKFTKSPNKSLKNKVISIDEVDDDDDFIDNNTRSEIHKNTKTNTTYPESSNNELKISSPTVKDIAIKSSSAITSVHHMIYVNNGPYVNHFAIIYKKVNSYKLDTIILTRYPSKLTDEIIQSYPLSREIKTFRKFGYISYNYEPQFDYLRSDFVLKFSRQLMSNITIITAEFTEKYLISQKLLGIYKKYITSPTTMISIKHSQSNKLDSNDNIDSEILRINQSSNNKFNDIFSSVNLAINKVVDGKERFNCIYDERTKTFKSSNETNSITQDHKTDLKNELPTRMVIIVGENLDYHDHLAYVRSWNTRDRCTLDVIKYFLNNDKLSYEVILNRLRLSNKNCKLVDRTDSRYKVAIAIQKQIEISNRNTLSLSNSRLGSDKNTNKNSKSKYRDSLSSNDFNSASINSSKDDEESIDSLQADESRNNLYWVSSPHNFACVWYGDPNLESSESLVDVHRIVLEKETSKNIVRSNLQPLDDKILNSTTDINPDLKDFLIALLEFSEWDDGLRGSYEWPDFIRNFAFDSQKLLVWLNNTISGGPLHIAWGHKSMRSKLFLLRLCSEHIGITDEYTYDSIKNTELCTNSFLEFCKHVSLITHFERDEHNHIRYSSRLGPSFQVLQLGDEDILYDWSVSDCSRSKQLLDISDSVYNEYLNRVQTINNNHIKVGMIIQIIPSTELSKKSRRREDIRRNRYITCNITNITESSNGLDNDIEVYDGIFTYKQKLKDCKLLSFSDDIAIDILKDNHDIDIELALTKYQQYIENLDISFYLWSIQEFVSLKQLIVRYGSDDRKIYDKMYSNKSLRSYRSFLYLYNLIYVSDHQES